MNQSAPPQAPVPQPQPPQRQTQPTEATQTRQQRSVVHHAPALSMEPSPGNIHACKTITPYDIYIRDNFTSVMIDYKLNAKTAMDMVRDQWLALPGEELQIYINMSFENK